MALVAVLTMSAQSSKNSEEKVYEVVEVMPEFPGGSAALMKFMQENIKYPAESAKRKEQGRVIVGFVVEKDGSLGTIQILKGVTPLLNKAAIDMVKKMPKWEAGNQDGKKVRVKYQVPVTFRLK